MQLMNRPQMTEEASVSRNGSHAAGWWEVPSRVSYSLAGVFRTGAKGSPMRAEPSLIKAEGPRRRAARARPQDPWRRRSSRRIAAQ